MKYSKIKILNSNGIFRLPLLLIAFLTFQCTFAQFTIPEKPSFQTSVYDYAAILNANEKAQLEEKLIRYSDSTSTQIVVITIESLKGEDIGILAPKWGQTWGIGGSEKNDNGVVILLAKAERKIWIAPGYGLEDKLTAGIGGEITRNIILPEFKAGSYYRGLDKGADALFDVFKGKYKGVRKKAAEKDFPILPFIFIIVMLIILFSKNKGGGNSGNRGGGGGPSLLDVIILSSLGRG
ncbi:MAG: TPM domain-containing protein, partial [Planktothrix sp.]